MLSQAGSGRYFSLFVEEVIVLRGGDTQVQKNPLQFSEGTSIF